MNIINARNVYTLSIGRIFVILIIGVVLFLANVSFADALPLANECYNFGDVDNSGAIGTFDINKINELLIFGIPLTLDEKYRANVDDSWGGGGASDPTVTQADIVQIQDYLSGARSDFDVCYTAFNKPIFSCNPTGNAFADSSGNKKVGFKQSVMVHDSLKILEHAAGLNPPFTANEFEQADVSGHGQVGGHPTNGSGITALDSTIILQYLEGIISDVGACFACGGGSCNNVGDVLNGGVYTASNCDNACCVDTLSSAASGPSPGSGAINVPVTTNLGWTWNAWGTECGNPDNGYNLYFEAGDSTPDVAVVFESPPGAASYNPPGDLAPGTTYYWKVRKCNQGRAFDCTESPVWSFTTEAICVDTLPSAASGPSPGSGAINVPVTTNLGWTWNAWGTECGNPDNGYNLYFEAGDSTPDVAVVFESPPGAASYNPPGDLAPGTTYYWKVRKCNQGRAFDCTESPVWSFTTEAAACSSTLPGISSTPSPAHGATGVSITPTLSWALGSWGTGCPANDNTYALYFGTDPTPDAGELMYNNASPATSIDLLAQLGLTLANSTTYYWRIDQCNESGATNCRTGDVWQFTTAAAGNNPPIAEAGISIDGGPYLQTVTVTQGVPVNVDLSADQDVTGDGLASRDPDGWTDPTNGVSNGGKCELNTDLDQGFPPVFEAADTVFDPLSATNCNKGLGSKTFNDPLGTYTYYVLQITDNQGAVSNIASVSITVAASPSNPPSAINLTVTNPADYCGFVDPPITLNWDYSDPDDVPLGTDPQSAYQVQVDDESTFTAPYVVDSGKVLSASTSYVPSGLSFNTTYYWRVTVWDSSDTSSAWAVGSSFTTFPRPPWPNFTCNGVDDCSVVPVLPGEVVTLGDTSTFYGGAVLSSRLWDLTASSGVLEPGFSDTVSPIDVKFSTGTNQPVSLQVTDTSGFSCSTTENLNVSGTLPEWKEISPTGWLSFPKFVFQNIGADKLLASIFSL